MRSCSVFCFASVIILSGIVEIRADAQEIQSPTIYDPTTQTYTMPAPAFTKSSAPPTPMEYRDALQNWDGTGELLLAPGAGIPLNSVFGIGATFDNSDAANGDVDSDDRAERRCPAGVMWYQLHDGWLSLSQAAFVRGDQVPRVIRSAAAPGITFTSGRCRYHLTVRAKIRGHDQWLAAPEMPPPDVKPAVPIGPTIHLKAGDKLVMEIGPVPQELLPMPQTSTTGQRLPQDVASQCPHLSGMVTFEPRGVYFDQPWAAEPPLTPGIRRDDQSKTTTLIFQNMECREEITVMREIQHNGVWQTSSLSPDPKSAELK